jgi:F-type H+-transporting ATPase subunit a
MFPFLNGTVVTVQVEIFSILIIATALMAFFFLANKAFKTVDPFAKPKGLVLFCTIMVGFFDKLTSDNMGKKAAHVYAPYIGSIALFMVVSNLSGLLGLAQPTANYSVTLTLALISFILIQSTIYKVVGLKQFFHRFIEPFPPFIIMNFFGTIAPLISMSLRLFGNITSGSIIMTLFYTFTGFISGLIPVIGKLDFVGIVIGPFLHAYFDVFAGFIQTYIFIMLTTIFIGNELPQD